MATYIPLESLDMIFKVQRKTPHTYLLEYDGCYLFVLRGTRGVSKVFICHQTLFCNMQVARVREISYITIKIERIRYA